MENFKSYRSFPRDVWNEALRMTKMQPIKDREHELKLTTCGI